MKIYRTLVLLIVLIALAGYVYFYEIKGGEEREKQKEIEEKVFNFETDSVDLVEIRSIFNRFTFERSGEEWLIKHPVETDGDKSTINSMLNSLKNMKKEREFTIKDGDQKDYGLVGRSLLVIMQFNNGIRDSIRFGDQTPVGNNVFAGRGDTTVFMVGSSVKQSAEKQLFDWRDKSVAKVELNDVREMHLKNKNGRFAFVKEGTEWRITEPRQVNAETYQVNNIVRKFENSKVKSVVSESLENPSKYGLNNPEYVIDLYIGEGKAHKQIIFSALEDNSAYGKDDSRPHVFTVDSLFIKDLNKNLFELRDKKIIASFNRDLIDSIEVNQGDSLITFTKDTSGTWSMENVDGSLKSWKMNSLLSNLTNLKAEKFIEENVRSTRKYGMQSPVRTVRIYSKGKMQGELFLAEPESDQYIAFCPGSGIVAEVTEMSYNNFEVKTGDYLETPKEEN
jgi:hypothetical protein